MGIMFQNFVLYVSNKKPCLLKEALLCKNAASLSQGERIWRALG